MQKRPVQSGSCSLKFRIWWPVFTPAGHHAGQTLPKANRNSENGLLYHITCIYYLYGLLRKRERERGESIKETLERTDCLREKLCHRGQDTRNYMKTHWNTSNVPPRKINGIRSIMIHCQTMSRGFCIAHFAIDRCLETPHSNLIKLDPLQVSHL